MNFELIKCVDVIFLLIVLFSHLCPCDYLLSKCVVENIIAGKCV